MKKLLFTALAVAAFGGTQVSAMSYHDNEIQLPSDVHLISYEITASCVTDGQDPNGDLNPGKFAIVEGNDTFMFHCGRHKSSNVGDWIKSHATYAESILTYGQSSFPGQANFATIGTMKLEYNGTLYAFENVLFAQYNDVAYNPWIISQVGARNLDLPTEPGWHKCAELYGYSIGGYKGSAAVTSRLSLPLSGGKNTSYKFYDDKDELAEQGYSPIEEIVNG